MAQAAEKIGPESVDGLIPATKKNIGYYRDRGDIILVTTELVQQINPMFLPVLSLVYADPNPDAGEVYPDSQNKDRMRLHARFVMKLGNEAGATFDTARCGQVKRTDDYLLYQAACGLRAPDGTLSGTQVAQKDIDFKVMAEEYLASKRAFIGKQTWAKDWTSQQKEAWAKDKAAEQLRELKKHANQRAESGAKFRALIALLGIQHSYTKKRLEHPFVVPKIIFKPDLNDPHTRQMFLMAGAQAMGLFGANPALLPVNQKDGLDTDYIEPPAEGPHAGEEPEPQTPTTPAQDSEKPPEDGGEDTELDDFACADRKSQIDWIKKLAERKGFDLTVRPDKKERAQKGGIGRPMEGLKDEQLTKMFIGLRKMEDAKAQEAEWQPADDDIPF